jgi:hypothetical protein
MFVRKKKNPSGIISVQMIDKSSGKYKVFRTVGSSSNEAEVKRLYNEGYEETVHINQNDLSAGIYYVKMTITDRVAIKKVVIQ